MTTTLLATTCKKTISAAQLLFRILTKKSKIVTRLGFSGVAVVGDLPKSPPKLPAGQKVVENPPGGVTTTAFLPFRGSYRDTTYPKPRKNRRVFMTAPIFPALFSRSKIYATNNTFSLYGSPIGWLTFLSRTKGWLVVPCPLPFSFDTRHVGNFKIVNTRQYL